MTHDHFHQLVYVVCLGLVVVCITSCDASRYRFESTNSPTTHTKVRYAFHFGWTPKGIADAYQSNGISVDYAERNIWSSSTVNVDVGPIKSVFRPSKMLPTLAPDTLSWDINFSDVRFVVPVRIRLMNGTHVCRIEVSSSKLESLTKVDLKHPAGKMPFFKLDGVPNVTNSSWTTKTIGECDTTSFPSSFDFQKGLILYANDAFVDSIGRLLQTFPSDPFGLLSGSKSLSASSNYTSRIGSLFVKPTAKTLQVRLDADGIRFLLPAEVGDQLAKCAPDEKLSVLQLPTPSDVLQDPILLAKQHGAPFAFVADQGIIQAILAAFVRSGAVCLGFEKNHAVLGDGSTIDTESIDLGTIGIGGLPFSELSQLVFLPTSLPRVSLNADSNQLHIYFPSVQIHLYTTLFHVPTRLFSADFAWNFNIAFQSNQEQVQFEMASLKVSSPRISFSIGTAKTLDQGLLAQWLKRLLVVALEDNVRNVFPWSSAKDVRWQKTLVKKQAIAFVGK